MIQKCKICDQPFSDKHPLHSGRPFRVCGECAPREEVKRHVGFTASLGKTHYWTEIAREPGKALVRSILTQSRCGPGHCHTSLGLSSNGATTPKGKMDRVLAKLYDEDGE